MLTDVPVTSMGMVIANAEENTGMSEPLPSTAFILLLFNKSRPSLSSNPGPLSSLPSPPPDSMSAQTVALFRSAYREPSALCSPAFPRRLPVSESGHQATTFKYLPRRLQSDKPSGEQTIQMPLPLHFDIISEFTNDPYILMSSSIPPPTCHPPCAYCHPALCYCIPDTTASKLHTTRELVHLHCEEETTKARGGGSACPRSYDQQEAKRNWTQ